MSGRPPERDPMHHSRTTIKYAGALALGAVLCACALTQLQVDRAARAPAIDGFGATTMPVATKSAEAARLFRQGMAQAYGFNDDEAVRAFKAALAADPGCIMCAWGVAWQLGPNINRARDKRVAEALHYVDHAKRLYAGATALEKSLVDALGRRYARGFEASRIVVEMAPMCAAGGRGGDIDALDMAYAVSMRQLAAAHPANPDVQSLYAEAEMIVTPMPWWDAQTGKAGGRLGAVGAMLESAMRQHPEHVGLNHYMIHAVDTNSQAPRAVPAADRLGRLAPLSPHLLHMPSHIYARVGRYSDALNVNTAALAAEDVLDATLARQDFKTLNDWRPHNSDFLIFSAIMAGQGDTAMRVTRLDAAKAEGDNDYREFRRSKPLLVLLRLERWNDILQEARPAGTRGVAQIAWLYARGMALARSGDAVAARKTLAELEPLVPPFVKDRPGEGYGQRLMRGMAEVALAELSGEIAAQEGRSDAALALYAAAVSANEVLDAAEPPVLASGARLTMGNFQLKLRKWTDAEATFRRDLVSNPGSGWALRGLARALRQQGRGEEAARVEAALAQAWRQADAELTASR